MEDETDAQSRFKKLALGQLLTERGVRVEETRGKVAARLPLSPDCPPAGFQTPRAGRLGLREATLDGERWASSLQLGGKGLGASPAASAK